MTADPPGQDPKTLWQDQEPETDPVTLEHVHTLSRRLDRRTRFTAPIMALTLIFVGIMVGQLWFGGHDPLQRVLAILMAIGELACFFMVYRVVFPPRDPAEPASVYLRRRLQRSLSYQQGGWTLAVLPLAPVILIAAYKVLIIQHGPLWPRIAPMLFMAAILVSVAVRTRIKARRTKAQLQELDALLNR